MLTEEEEIIEKKAVPRFLLLALYLAFLALDCFLLFKSKFSYRVCAKPLLIPILASYLFVRRPRLVGIIKQDKELNLLLIGLSISWLSDILAVTANFWLLTFSTFLYLVIYPIYLLLFFRLWKKFLPAKDLYNKNMTGLITMISAIAVITFFLLKVLNIYIEWINVPLFFHGLVLALLISLVVSMIKIPNLKPYIYLPILAVTCMLMANVAYAYTIFKAINKIRQLFCLTALANGMSQLLMVICVLRFIKEKKLTRPRTSRIKAKTVGSDGVANNSFNFDSVLAELKSQYNNLPKEAKGFLQNGLIILSLYLIGDYFLFNTNYWLNRDLTFITTDFTTTALNWFYKIGFILKSNAAIGNCEIYYLGTQKVLLVSNGCNASKLYVFYLGFLFCLPGGAIKKWLYGVIGVVTIFCLNIGRCFALTWLSINRPELTDFAHHYAFTFFVYSAIFFLFWNFLQINDRIKEGHAVKS